MKEASIRGVLVLASVALLATCHGTISEKDLLESGFTAEDLQQVIKEIRARTNPDDTVPGIVAMLNAGSLSDLEGSPPNLMDLVGPDVSSVAFDPVVGPQITVSGASQSVAGGTVMLTLRSVPSPNPALPPNEFNFVFVTIGGAPGGAAPDGYYVLRIDGDPSDPDLDPVTEVELFITLPANVPYSDFVCTYRAGLLTVPSGSSAGPLVVGGAAETPIDIRQVARGPLQATLTWTSGADLDLSVFDPRGREIGLEGANRSLGVVAQGTKGSNCGTAGGQLFYETLTWGVDEAGIPDPIVGDYTAVVVNQDGCSVGETDFVLTILTGGEVQQVIGGRVDMGAMESLPFQFPFRASLSLAQAVDDPTPEEFETVVFTTTVTNVGGSHENTATGVQVVDDLPAGLDAVSVLGVTAGTTDTSTDPDGSVRITWDVGDLPRGAAAEMTVQAEIAFGAATLSPLTSVATATADQFEENQLEIAEVRLDVVDQGFVDLGVTKTVDRAVANEQDVVEFTIDVLNHPGHADASQVVVTDLPPAGLTFVSATVSQGVLDPPSGRWEVGTLAAGDSAQLVVRVRVDAGTAGQTLVNTATVSSDNSDPLSGNDSDSAQVRINVAPTANAGPDQTVDDVAPTGSESVTLDGSASSDADGTIAGYEWSEAGSVIATGPNPTVSLTAGAHVITLTVTDDTGATDADDVVVTVNSLPTANAGPDQTLEDDDGSGNESVTLDGSGSSDPDGSIASFEWFEGGNLLGTGSSLTVNLAVGVHTITLRVTDANAAVDTDQVIVTVRPNVVPVANAGPDQTVDDLPPLGAELVTLNGTGSNDPGEGNIVSYQWSYDGVVIATGPTPTVSLPPGVHTIVLTVTDNGGAMDTDDVVVTVNQTPTADAGPDQVVFDADGNGAQGVRLDGTGSHDPDGSIVSYVWREGGNQIASGPTPLVNLAVGNHVITLTVTDDRGATGADQVMVTVEANQPPTANAGPDQTVNDVAPLGSEPVTLDGTASSDPEGTMLSGVWSENGNVIAGGLNPTVALAPGVHTITLTVTDAGGATDADVVVITVNGPPVADAGSDQTLSDHDGNGQELAMLDGSNSFDPDGTIVSYVWRDGAGQVVSTNPTFELDLSVGEHVFTLTVTDDDGSTDSASVVVTVDPNVAPSADAGPDQTVTDVDPLGDEDVTLDGTRSSDPDGTIVSYVWSYDGVAIATGPTPTVNLPSGTHSLELAVTDDGGATDFDTVEITIDTPQPPFLDPSTITSRLISLNSCPNNGSYIVVDFDYTDPNGDVTSPRFPLVPNSTVVVVAYQFEDGTSGGFINNEFTTLVSGDGFAGHMRTGLCIFFGNSSYVDETIVITDAEGNQSNAIMIRILRPAGGN